MITPRKIGKWFHVLGGKKADERLVPQPSASALPYEVPEEEEEVVEEGEIVPGVEGTGTFHYSSLDELLDSMDADSWFPCPIHITQGMEERKSKKRNLYGRVPLL